MDIGQCTVNKDIPCKEGLDKDQRSPTKEDELKDNQKGNREGDEIDMCRSRASQRAGMQSLEPPPIHVPPTAPSWHTGQSGTTGCHKMLLEPLCTFSILADWGKVAMYCTSVFGTSSNPCTTTFFILAHCGLGIVALCCTCLLHQTTFLILSMSGWHNLWGYS